MLNFNRTLLFFVAASVSFGIGCKCLPEEKFLSSAKDRHDEKYDLIRTSPTMLRMQLASELTQVLFAYDSIKRKFQHLAEVVQYADQKSAVIGKRVDRDLRRIDEIEKRMREGDSLLLYTFTKGTNSESGALILDSEGRLVWRDITDANYPFWEQPQPVR